MKPAVTHCDRCGQPINRTGPGYGYCWRWIEFGDSSFALVDCGCEVGSARDAILRRAHRVSKRWADAVKATIRRYDAARWARALAADKEKAAVGAAASV